MITLGPSDYNPVAAQSAVDELQAAGHKELAAHAQALMGAVEHVKCYRTAARLLGLRLQEVRGGARH
jgi:hypothetical protein